jgi:1-acyl-sn-glycerol-3-phosphate acyltransferase
VWSSLLYRSLAWLLGHTLWRGELRGGGNLPGRGPAVIVANHAGALGPIALCVSLKPRLYPWVISEMLDLDRAAPYLRRDFTTRELRLSGRTSTAVSVVLARIAVGLLQTIQCIPVWSDKKVLSTYRQSSDYLERGRILLIFPEDPTQAPHAETGMRPFKPGFARLGRLHFSRTGQRLPFLPAAVSGTNRTVQLGAPSAFDPGRTGGREHLRITGELELAIGAMLGGQKSLPRD